MYYTPLWLADKRDTELNQKINKTLVDAGAKICSAWGPPGPDGRVNLFSGKPSDDCNL